MATIEEKISELRSGQLGTVELITKEIIKLNEQISVIQGKIVKLSEKRAYLETIEKLEKE